MEKPHFYYDITYFLLYRFYERADVHILTERSNPPKQIDYYIISKGIVGSIKTTEIGAAEIYEEERFIRRLSSYEWELFKPYVKTVDYYECLLRTDYVNKFFIKHSKYIGHLYYQIIRYWNESIWYESYYIIEEMNKAGLKDQFTFGIWTYTWSKHFLCTVSYSYKKKELVLNLYINDVHFEGKR